MDSRQQRVAENEVLLRGVNEQIHTLDVRLGVNGPAVQQFLCECGSLECTERIDLSVEEYERVHADPTRFAIVEGHEDPSVETVVERHDGFSVIQKDEGGPAEFAAAHERNSDR